MANPAQNKDRAAVESGLNDLLGNVIRNDRTRAGRGGANVQEASPTPAEAAAPPQSTLEGAAISADGPTERTEDQEKQVPENSAPENQLSSVMTLTHNDIMTNGQVGLDPDPETEVPNSQVAPARRTARTARAVNARHSSGRVEEAEVLAATPTMTVTLRIPQGLNEWLDGYVHGSWPRKIRKQELVVEALKLAYARRGKAGEEVIETELLGGSNGA